MRAHRPRTRRSVIGLDIGSHSIRAAEVRTNGGDGGVLERYAEVKLAPGVVTDGEVVDAGEVAKALKQLWSNGRFTHRRVVVGVSSRRVVVRQADVAALCDEELHSALQFEAEDLIPMPVAEAVLDFSTIEPLVANPDKAAAPKSKILLVAAPRDMVDGHMAALAAGGLRAVAVDPVALALLRATPSKAPDGPYPHGPSAALTEAVIAIGGSSTTLAIRENGVARFVRVLNTGGDALRAAKVADADRETSPPDVAPRAAALFSATMTATRAVASGPMHALVSDLRGSIDFYLAQAGTDRVDRVVVTGGGSLVDGFLLRLQEALGQRVELADPLTTMPAGRTGLSPEQLAEAVPYMVTPIGLALWGRGPGRSISLLPAELTRARRERHQAVAAAGVLVVLVALLAVFWSGRSGKVSAAEQATARANAQVAVLNARVSALSRGTEVKAQADGRQQLYGGAVKGEIDWTALLGQIGAVTPPDVRLSTVSFVPAATASGGSTSSAAPGYGSISVTGVADGGPPSVAAWLRALQSLPALSTPWVQTIDQTNGPAGAGVGPVSFTSTASLTQAAQSQRATHPGGQS